MDCRRIPKELTFALIRKLGPYLVDMLGGLQSPRTWRSFAEQLASKRAEFKVEDYVGLYDDEKKLWVTVLLALFGVDGVKALDAQLREAGPGADLALAEEMAQSFIEDGDAFLADIFPEDPDSIEGRQAAYAALPDEHKKEATWRTQYLWAMFLAWFHETVSIMVNGQKLTKLVPAAAAGDDVAFFKAYHIDRYLLQGHRAFRERFERARESGDERFLRKLGYHISAPPLKGRIKFPVLYIVFGLLESLDWLEDSTRSDIVGLCDDLCPDRRNAGLGDEGYVARRLREYRRYQRKKGASRH